MPMRPLVFTSYNIHRCIGVDGRYEPDRIAGVIRELAADVVALQEVDARYHVEHGVDQILHLAAAAGYEAIPGPVLRNHCGTYGNGLLVRGGVLNVRRIDLSHRGRERRGALDVDLKLDRRGIRVVATHLGLRAAERRRQVGRLLALLRDDVETPLVLLGDFNEWFVGSPLLQRLHRRFGPTSGLRTFPSRFPVFALDRIWVQPRRALLEVRVHASRLARQASDHLPIRAVVDGLGG
jgi:endonuclease/exonuclease/phosphatase family metal-dependent hydrolase